MAKGVGTSKKTDHTKDCKVEKENLGISCSIKEKESFSTLQFTIDISIRTYLKEQDTSNESYHVEAGMAALAFQFVAFDNLEHR